MSTPDSAARRYTILYLDHTAKWSGGEIALLRALTAVDPAKVDPVVLLASEGPFADRLREAGVKTHVMPLSEGAREVRKDSLKGPAALLKQVGKGFFEYWGYASKIAKFARERGVDLIHCNSLKSDFYGALAGRMARIPVLWHVRDHIDPSYLPAKMVMAFRSLAKWLPRYVVTNSESTTEKLFPGGVSASRCRTVHDGLAMDELGTPVPPEQSAWRHNPPRIGMVGRLVEWKGQRIFLDAARRLTESGVEARYILIGAPLFGEHDYEAELRKMAEPLGDRVEFLGFRTDIPDLVRNLDILVHASITPEPFGQVVIEGMAEGVPVIASRGGGVIEIIRDGTDGVLSPMGDSAALAEAMRSLIGDPVRGSRLARAGWQRVRDLFTAPHTARALEAVYGDLLRDAPFRSRASRSAFPPGAAEDDVKKAVEKA